MNRLTALFGAAIGIAALQPTDARAAASEYSGVYQLTVTIRSATAVPSGQALYCLFTVSDQGDANGNNKGYGAAVATLDPAGTAGTCSIQIPYAWSLSNASTNTVTPSYAVVMASSGSSKVSLAISSLSAKVNVLPVISGVPASGTTTKLAATFRL